ncbi:MAG: nuclease [Acidobacteria bacterium]|nr:MAG: nuclease [Acidobacteriota bacterium]
MRSSLVCALILCAASLGIECAATPIPRSTSSIVSTAPVTRGIVISQVYGGGGNIGAPFTNAYVELFNGTSVPVNLTGWSVQYSPANGTTWEVTNLAGTIQPDSYYLVREGGGANGVPLPPPDAIGGIAMNATNGKVALANTTAALSGSCPTASVFLSDFVGYGSANCFEGTRGTGALSSPKAALRLGGGDVDTDDNAADFIIGEPAPHNSRGIPPFGAGAAMPQSVPPGGTILLIVLVTPGARPANTNISVTGDLSPIGGGTNASFFDDGTHGDVVAHDNRFSLSTIVTGTAAVRTLSITVSDNVPRTSASTIVLAIETAITAIHDIQGPGPTSPLVDKYVTTKGIVTAIKFNGVFIQLRDVETDADDRTSEGLFVFTGVSPPAFLATGQEVVASGTVHEFVPIADPGSPPVTELGNAFFRVTMTGEMLPHPVTLRSSYTDPAGNFEQLERFEGMRVSANIVAISPTEGYVDETTATSTSTGVFYAVIHGVARPLREPGIEPAQTLPDDAPPHIPRFDGNPERLRVDSGALPGARRIEAVAGQVLTAITGPLDYASRSYTILPDPPSVSGTAWTSTGNAAAVSVPPASPREFTIGHYNLERFFDDVDDPARDDAVLTTNALNGRLAKASLAIRHVLRAPDVLGVVEVENLSVLRRLAVQISADAIRDAEADPKYDAFLEEGNDIGGIDVGFLVKRAAGRVHVVKITQVGKDATYTAPDGGTLLLNDRPSLALEAAVTSPRGVKYPVTVILNHLRSLRGIDGDDGARIRVKRRAQAEFLANYIQSRQAAKPDERIISVGDYNAFPFNDGYVDVMGTIEGRPTPADRVVLASPDLVNPDLTNVVDLLPAAQRYSFSFAGNAQALDHVLVNEPARRRFTRMAYARLDADFPESFRGDITRPERLSDHDAAIAYFSFPEAPVLTLNGALRMRVTAFTSFTDPGAVAMDRGATPDQNRPLSVRVTGGVDVTKPGTYRLTYTASNGIFTTTVRRTVIVKSARGAGL